MSDEIYERLKRVLDVTASAAGMMTLAPLYVLIAAAVKLDSPGPCLYGGERVGRGFRPFRVWKFRTMVTDADRVGLGVTAGGDPRVTRIGSVLRAWKLDELPQLWNVFVGEMSLVGPRPETAYYVEAFRKDYEEILTVRPGITDDAAIAFRNEEDVLADADDVEKTYLEEVLPKKIELYMDYLRSRSLRRDVSILVRTIGKIVTR